MGIELEMLERKVVSIEDMVNEQNNLLESITKIIGGNDSNMTLISKCMLQSAEAIKAVSSENKRIKQDIEHLKNILSINGITDLSGS